MFIQQMTVDDNAYVATFPTKDRFATCYNSTIRRINPPIPDDLDELDIPAPFNAFRGQAFVLHQRTFVVNDNRTNNDIEGWHNKLNKVIGLNCTLWKFIKGLKVMHGYAEADFERILRGEAITKQKQVQGDE